VELEDLVLPSVAALTPYEPGKPIEEVQRELGVEPVKLASNENPLGPSPRALAAIRQALADLNRYPDGGSYELVRRLGARHGLSPGHIFMACGSVEVLNLVAYLFIRPGLNAITSEHAFAIYELVVAASGGQVRSAPMRAYGFDLEAIAGLIDRDTRVVFLANPNNPTGTIYRRDQWHRFLSALPDHVVVVADEAYFEFVHATDYPDALEDLAHQPKLIVLRTFSKIYGLAGLRVGYAVAHPNFVRLLHQVRQPFNINLLAQVAVREALEDREHVERTLANNREGMEYLERELARLRLRFVPSQANFIMVDVGKGRAVFDALLKEGVIVRPLDAYRLPRHVRVSVGLPEENRRFVQALEKILGRAGEAT
jgi:histidinol-phosphate aminotransferase